MELRSEAFNQNEEIPARYTCEGGNVSPPLRWNEVPDGAESLVLIVDDPDAPDPAAPRMIFVHWVLYNLPAADGALPEAVAATDLPPGTRVGQNDWKRAEFGGPCPPVGRHRYFFKLYALDTSLPDLGPVTKCDLEARMEGHVLAQCELLGTYRKRGH